MNQQSDDFRDRLIGAQKMSAEYERDYRRELDNIISQQLTPTQRRMQLVGAVVFLAMGLTFLLTPEVYGRLNSLVRIRVQLIGTMALCYSAYYVWVFFCKRIDLRSHPVIVGAMSLVIPVIIGATLVPGSLGELREYVVAMSIVVLVLLLLLAVRLIQTDLRMREETLLLRYRIAEIAEKVEQQGAE